MWQLRSCKSSVMASNVRISCKVNTHTYLRKPGTRKPQVTSVDGHKWSETEICTIRLHCGLLFGKGLPTRSALETDISISERQLNAVNLAHPCVQQIISWILKDSS
jgi:hypothetical protein